jgi:signal transduction histidine kinase
LYVGGGNTGQTETVNLLLPALSHPAAMRPRWLTAHARWPRPTVRLRLTLLYGALFLASGAALLTITYVLVRQSTGGHPMGVRTPTTQPNSLSHSGPVLPQQPQALARQGRAQAQQIERNAQRQRADDLNQLLIDAGIALGIMAAGSMMLGWVIAGRVLRPLRTMTAKTRRISDANLHERVAINGPSDELKELGDTIDGLLARLQAAFDAQRRFVANASHELRTPLAMLRTSLDVATGKPGPVSPQVRALDAKLREGLDQADRLLDSFLMLARAEYGALDELTPVAVDELVATALESRQHVIANAGLRVEQELGDMYVTGSPTLLTRMVENVIDNAINHNEPGGWVRIRTQTVGTSATLIVESGGPMLDEDVVRELTQPFRRLAAERTGSEQGPGLGLSIVEAIAAAHNGKPQLHARPHGGLQVIIDLPALSAAAALPA